VETVWFDVDAGSGRRCWFDAGVAIDSGFSLPFKQVLGIVGYHHIVIHCLQLTIRITSAFLLLVTIAGRPSHRISISSLPSSKDSFGAERSHKLPLSLCFGHLDRRVGVIVLLLHPRGLESHLLALLKWCLCYLWGVLPIDLCFFVDSHPPRELRQ
jgi:hypothetical protein